MYLINWLVRHQNAVYCGKNKNERIVSVIQVISGDAGNLKSSGEYFRINISNLDQSIKSKAFVGIKIECERYMPTYTPYDILLIARDREPKYFENSIILVGNNFRIARRVFEDNAYKYRSIRDRHLISMECDVDEVVGYIAYILKNEEIRIVE
jgi:hypothetical protein